MTELEALRLLDPARFWALVDVATEGCWPWKGRPNHAGYGRLHLGGRAGRHVLAHRISFFLHNGFLTDGLEVLHRCDNPICVKPADLRSTGRTHAPIAVAQASGTGCMCSPSSRRWRFCGDVTLDRREERWRRSLENWGLRPRPSATSSADAGGSTCRGGPHDRFRQSPLRLGARSARPALAPRLAPLPQAAPRRALRAEGRVNCARCGHALALHGRRGHGSCRHGRGGGLAAAVATLRACIAGTPEAERKELVARALVETKPCGCLRALKRPPTS